MRKEERWEECDTTTHLIVFTHDSCVTNFSTHNTVQVQLVAFALLEVSITGFRGFSCQCRNARGW